MVEAVIPAAGTGLPILTLSLTLTVRIILLCLTSLPLALLALIGIAGMPLSSYIILFFRFLRNRRNLNKSGGKSSRKQAILPTWDKKSGPSTAVQPAAYKKDGSRIRFAKRHAPPDAGHRLSAEEAGGTPRQSACSVCADSENRKRHCLHDRPPIYQDPGDRAD
ncbi:MAG: hypothetical protein ACLS3C_16330 [Oscillospiraceae bacterium]